MYAQVAMKIIVLTMMHLILNHATEVLFYCCRHLKDSLWYVA